VEQTGSVEIEDRVVYCSSVEASSSEAAAETSDQAAEPGGEVVEELAGEEAISVSESPGDPSEVEEVELSQVRDPVLVQSV